MNGQRDLDGDDVRGSQDGGKDLLEDFSDGLEALMAVPVWFLSTWIFTIFTLVVIHFTFSNMNIK